MAAFLVRNNLSRGDLQLFLSNNNGYAQDAASVKWTVFSQDGSQVSGRSLPAIRQKVGQYYAPWFTDVPNGNYKVIWEVTQEFGGPTVNLTDFVFVVDPSDYQCGYPTNPRAVPVHGELTFLTGQALGPGDLALYLKNTDGLLQNAFVVFFTIYDVANNCIARRAAALNYGTGTYYAPWFVSLCSGNYIVEWEWQTDQCSPMKSARVGFSVVDMAAPYSIVVPILCSSSLFANGLGCGFTTKPILTRILVSQCDLGGGGSCGAYRQLPCQTFTPPQVFPPMPPRPINPDCCDIEIPRTIHLPYFTLPSTGSQTSQSKFCIPDGVKNVTFYITYARGAIGGFASLQLRWGNGIEESNETLIDHNVTLSEPSASQNLYLQTMNGPTPVSGLPITFILETTVPGGATTVRLLASEGGVPGAPGSCGITLTASS